MRKAARAPVSSPLRTAMERELEPLSLERVHTTPDNEQPVSCPLRTAMEHELEPSSLERVHMTPDDEQPVSSPLRTAMERELEPSSWERGHTAPGDEKSPARNGAGRLRAEARPFKPSHGVFPEATAQPSPSDEGREVGVQPREERVRASPPIAARKLTCRKPVREAVRAPVSCPVWTAMERELEPSSLERVQTTPDDEQPVSSPRRTATEHKLEPSSLERVHTPPDDEKSTAKNGAGRLRAEACPFKPSHGVLPEATAQPSPLDEGREAGVQPILHPTQWLCSVYRSRHI